MGQAESAPQSSRQESLGNRHAKYPANVPPIILGRFLVDMSEDGFMGQGSFSTCWIANTTDTDETVAVKFFKSARVNKVQMLKLTRQVEVLTELETDFVEPEDSRLWNPELATAKPSNLFMRLIDYTKDESGVPGPDAKDNYIAVVTELAQYSLQDYLVELRQDDKALSHPTVRSIIKALLLVVAGLHAKGMVHLDLKPENLMVFEGLLKLIDVDGVVKIGSTIRISDQTIAFTPCYCSPEWAAFMVGSVESISVATVAQPSFDVWSVGCTICELITLTSIMKPVYANLLRRAKSHREASLNFLDWLHNLQADFVPKKVLDFDKDLANLLESFIMVPSSSERKTCAECLSHKYLKGDARKMLHRSDTNPLSHTADETVAKVSHMPETAKRQMRHRTEDTNDHAVHRGTLWKLNSGKDLKDESQWLQRDMWIANNGSLCYYSKAEEKRLVLMDAHQLFGAEISEHKGAAREHSFVVYPTHIEAPGDKPQEIYFAAASAEEKDQWIEFLKKAAHVEMMPTMFFGQSLAVAVHDFKLGVKNRRLKVVKEHGDDKGLKPIRKGFLWKVKADGDLMKEKHWFKREMWLAQNGCLIYWSPKDERELVYYTAADVQSATVQEVPPEGSLKPWTFRVHLPPIHGIGFAPGEFAAESDADRISWMVALRHGKDEDKRSAATPPQASCFLSYLQCCVKEGRKGEQEGKVTK